MGFKAKPDAPVSTPDAPGNVPVGALLLHNWNLTKKMIQKHGDYLASQKTELASKNCTCYIVSLEHKAHNRPIFTVNASN